MSSNSKNPRDRFRRHRRSRLGLTIPPGVRHPRRRGEHDDIEASVSEGQVGAVGHLETQQVGSRSNARGGRVVAVEGLEGAAGDEDAMGLPQGGSGIGDVALDEARARIDANDLSDTPGSAATSRATIPVRQPTSSTRVPSRRGSRDRKCWRRARWRVQRPVSRAGWRARRPWRRRARCSAVRVGGLGRCWFAAVIVLPVFAHRTCGRTSPPPSARRPRSRPTNATQPRRPPLACSCRWVRVSRAGRLAGRAERMWVP